MNKNLDINKIFWVVGSLEEVGGGERLLFEGARHYRNLGKQVHIITWNFDKKSLFNGLYEEKDIVNLGSGSRFDRRLVILRSLHRIKSFFKFRRLLKQHRPDLIICQNEYDCSFLYLSNVGIKIPYICLIFGQTYQFPYDLAKYMLVFKKHLTKVKQSKGYFDEIPDKMPKTMPWTRWMMELICWIRYHAVRNARALFVFSKQVQWEVELMYGRSSKILKGAYREELLGLIPNRQLIGKHRRSDEQRIFFAVSRLVKKKRVDVMIRAFQHYLKRYGKNDLLLIGGTGQEEMNYKALVLELGLSDNVVFLGYIKEDQLLHLTGGCDVFVSLDIADFDISPYTALGLKIPVIWSSEMDKDEFLDNYPLLFETDPLPEDIAEVMHRAAQYSSDSNKNEIQNWNKGLINYTWESYFDGILKYTLDPRTRIN